MKGGGEMAQVNVNVARRTEVGRPFSGVSEVSEKRDLLIKDLRRSLEKQWGKVIAGGIGFCLKVAIWAVNNLLPFTQRFIVKTEVTFGLTNGVGIVRHDMLANMFGNGRELFGLSRIPHFAKDVGRVYLLKTYDASYEHKADFVFGDIIRMVIDVIEVRGASFKLRGRFINKKTGQLCLTAYHTIVYTNMRGMPARFPTWLKVLLALTCRQNRDKESMDVGDDLPQGRLVLQYQAIVTSDMINAEKNVSHDIYARMLTQMMELFFLGMADRQACLFKVAKGSYEYGRDFYFGDSITAKLYLIEADERSAVFRAEFCNADGKPHISGRQMIVFTNDKGIPQSIPQELVDAIKTA